MRCLSNHRLGVAAATILAPAQAFASDFYSLIVVFVAFGIAIVLAIQSLIGIVLVIDKWYVTKKPTLFIEIAAVFLAIGTLMVLDESPHLTSEDLFVCFASMFIPGAIAILPPLIQHASSKQKSSES